MSIKSNNEKTKFLGMPIGTAQNRLKKNILFSLVQETGKDICFRCGKKIESVDELSIEHKKPWLKESIDLFWNLENISFSHLNCNSGARRNRKGKLVHGTRHGYEKYKCRCDKCKEAKRKHNLQRKVKGWR